MTDIDTIREQHRPWPDKSPRPEDMRQFCSAPGCTQSWPCDTRVVLDALDRALVAAEGLSEADKRHRDAHEMAS